VNVLPVSAPGVAHGLGLFETMLAKGGKVLLLGEHLMRMTRSAAELGFPLPDPDRFRKASVEEVAGLEETALRGVYVSHSASDWILDVSRMPIPALTLARREGTHAVTLDRNFRRSLPAHKLTSYAPCILGLRHAVEQGGNEGFFAGAEGYLEGTATNLFAVRGSTLITAASDVLPGVMRAWILTTAATQGLAIEYRNPTRDEVVAGSFVTGSLTLFSPVVTLDGERCAAPGPTFANLQSAWRAGFE
jgi:branched-chain amino acid aminotransferase